MSTKPLILYNVSVGTRLLPFSAQVERGALIHIIGPNGAGKSTLLARIAGILPGEGRVMLNQQNLDALTPAELARCRGYLHQQQQPSALFPVFQYLALHQPVGCDLNHTQLHAHQVWMLRAGVMQDQGPTTEVMTVKSLSKLYGINFRELESEGQRWFIYQNHI